MNPAFFNQVAYDGVYKAVLAQPSDEPYATIAFAFAHPWIMAPLAFFALAVELGAPLALVHRRIGQVWVAATFGMHWGIHLFMNLVFPYPIFGFAFLYRDKREGEEGGDGAASAI